VQHAVTGRGELVHAGSVPLGGGANADRYKVPSKTSLRQVGSESYSAVRNLTNG
jgi:hypothetical protein